MPRRMLQPAGGIGFHCKVVCLGMQATCPDETAIVLVHGFGAGAFAWRNVMQPLADSAGCRVIAFDRPAFGALPKLYCSLTIVITVITRASRGQVCAGQLLSRQTGLF